MDTLDDKYVSSFDFERRSKRKAAEKELKISESDMKHTVKNIIEECMDVITEHFRFEPRHYIYIPSKSVVSIKVTFLPLPSGLYTEEYFVHFEDIDRNSVNKVKLPVFASTLPFPLSVKPVVISFNTCLFDCDVYQAQFSVVNSTSMAVKLAAKVPKELQSHAQIVPSETYVQPISSATFSIRLTPKYSLQKCAPKYYKNDIEVLDFPVLILPSHRSLGQCPEFIVQVLAVVTSPYALEISPSYSNLGIVSTQETVCKVFTLINKSNAWLHYEFPNTPESVQIQPNYGFGLIGPREHRKLHLLYSPKVSDIEGNKSLQRDGISGCHKFYLKVVSAASQAGIEGGNEKLFLNIQEIMKKSFIKDFLDSECETFLAKKTTNFFDDTQSILSDLSSDESASAPVKKKKTKGSKKKENTEKSSKAGTSVKDKSVTSKADSKSNPLLQNMNDILQPNDKNVIDSGDESEDSFEDEEFTYNMSLDSCLKSVLFCQAFVVDTLCELSHTKLILPPTPCGSYSLTTFYLHGHNLTSKPDCHCGILSTWSEKLKNMEARFSFHTNYNQLTIEPNCGHFTIGQDVKVTAVFKPCLPQKAIETQARRLKVQMLMEQQKAAEKEKEMRKSIKKSVKFPKRGSKRGSDGKSVSSKEGKRKTKDIDEKSNKEKGKKTKTEGIIEPEKKETQGSIVLEKVSSRVEILPEDILPAEKSLLEILDPHCILVRVKCLVEILNFPNSKMPRSEVHRMEITCPVVKPDIVLLGTSQHVKFGPIAVGIRSCHVLRVQNMTQEIISVSTSLINSVGYFTCPSSKTIVAPEHILLLPITFLPQKETNEENEFFEIYSGRTIIGIRLSGEGVPPKYDISPEFLVYRFDYKKSLGKIRDECVIEIYNKCRAPLPFSLVEETLAYKEEIRMSAIPSEIDVTDEKKDKKKKSTQKLKKGGEKRSRSGSRGRKTKKSLGKVWKQMDGELQPEEVTTLTENVTDVGTIGSPFRTIIEDGGNEFVVPPMQKISFIVKFSLPELNVEDSSMEKDISQRQSSASGKKGKKRKKSAKGKDKRKPRAKSRAGSKGRGDDTPRLNDQTGKTSLDPDANQIQKKIQYAAKYNLILGKTMNVKEFYFTVSSGVKIQGELKTKK